LPGDIPDGEFDLIEFCEIGYYFDSDALGALVAELVHRLPQNGVFLAAHRLGTSRDHRLHGHEVHRIVGATPKLRPSAAQRFPGFRIERWTKS
jgi:hypothetical protein